MKLEVGDCYKTREKQQHLDRENTWLLETTEIETFEDEHNPLWRSSLTISHVKLLRHIVSMSPQLPHLSARECYFYSYSFGKTLIIEIADVT